MVLNELNLWIPIIEDSPPYCENPTWFEVVYEDGSKDTLCRWWDHWYCCILSGEVKYWRIKDDDKS